MPELGARRPTTRSFGIGSVTGVSFWEADAQLSREPADFRVESIQFDSSEEQ